MPLYFRAIYPFEGDVSKDQLCFPAGAVITVTDPSLMNLNGWSLGEYEGRRGWIPDIYVEAILPPVSSATSSNQVHPPDLSRRPAATRLPWEQKVDEQRQDVADGFDGPPMGGYSEAVARQQPQAQQQEEEVVTVIDTSPKSKRQAAVQAVKKTGKGIRKKLVSVSSKTGHFVSSTGNKIRNRNRVDDDSRSYSKPSVSVSPGQEAP